MNVREAIEALQKIENKELPVYFHHTEPDDDGGYTVWEETYEIYSTHAYVNGYRNPNKEIVTID
jgi:hypothetical protein